MSAHLSRLRLSSAADVSDFGEDERERVLFIGTQFSNLYTAVDTPAMGRVVVCLVFVYLVCVCKHVLGHSRVSQPLNLRLCLLWHPGFLTSPHASQVSSLESRILCISVSDKEISGVGCLHSLYFEDSVACEDTRFLSLLTACF